MADGDDDKAHDGEKPGPVQQAPAPAEPATNDGPTSHPAAQPRSPQSEWTVSDRRGPLDSAEEGSDEGDVERFVPAHETDAIGVEDHGTAPSREHSIEEQPSAPEEAPPPTSSPAAADTDETPRSNAPITAETPRPEASIAAADPQQARSSALPVVGGLIGGAVLGAAVAALIFSSQKPEPGSGGQVAALSSRVDALEQRPNPQLPLATLQSSVGDLYNKVAALQKAAPVPQQAAPAAPSPAAKSIGASADVGPLQQKIADLTASLTRLQSQTKSLQQQAAEAQGLSGKLTTLEAAVTGAQKQASTAQSSVEAVQAQQKSLEGKVGTPALAVIADSLMQQVDHGEPFVTHVDALASLGADPSKVAVLKQYADKGVPSASTLAAQFAPLAEPMIAVTHQAPPNAGFMDRFKSGMAGLVTIRRSDSATGNDVPSRISRIETSLAHDDVTEAYETWNLLPAEAKAKSEAWGALAKTSAVARAAAHSLQREAIISLGVKKS